MTSGRLDRLSRTRSVWLRRPKYPRVARTVCALCLRGLLVGAGIGINGDADPKASELVPLRIRVTFAIDPGQRRHMVPQGTISQARSRRGHMAQMTKQTPTSAGEIDLILHHLATSAPRRG